MGAQKGKRTLAELWKKHLQVLLVTAMVTVIAACGGQPEDDLDIEDVFPPNLTVSDAAVAEGGDLIFTLNIDYTQGVDVSVDFAVVDVSTTDGVDYPSTSGTVVIPASLDILTASITIPTTQDTLDEDDEQFTLELSNPVDTTIVDGTGTGTIIDDDPLPLISVYAVSINEGDVATVEVSLSEISGRDVSVNYSTTDGSAVSGSDYVPASGALVIPAGSQSTNFSVTSVNDGTPETPLESFSVNLSSPSNAGAGVMSALVEIGDDDAGANPDAFIEDVTVVEPNDLVFNVTFSFPTPSPSSFDYQSYDGSATQALDYSSTSGTASVGAGLTTASITVSGLDDNVFEGTETFTLSLSNFVGLNNGDDLAVGTITDDEVMPDLVVYDVSVTEGGTLLFEVSLSGPTTAEVTYSLATTPGSASSGLDYAAVTAGATIAPLSLLNQHQVYTVDDSLDEDAEDLTLDLASVVGANPLDSSGVGSIGDNDAPPVVNISGVSVFEGGTLNFVASLTALSSKEITFVYQTYDESATAGADYVGGSFLTTIPAGSSSVVLPVTSIQELVDEPDETFAVSLGSLINVQAGVIGAQGTIQNDDVPPDLQILDSLVDEGDNAFVLVTLSHASGSDVVFDYTTVDGTATAAGDYVAETATITISPGNLFHLIGIVTVEDLIEETGELFSVSVTSLVGANPVDMNAVVAVTDDDIVPDAFIDDVSVTEGASAVLSVTLDDIPTADVVINYLSYDGSAGSSADFSAISGQMTIVTGNQTGALTVATVDDLIVEFPEDFVVSLDVVSGGVVGDGLGSVTIFDNDVYPDIFVSDVTSEEGETFAFVVSLNIPAPQPVFFDYTTADNTATQPGDYGAISGSSSLDTGELSVTFNVNTVENSVDQADRDFTFDISNVTFATVSVSSGAGNIVDDDARIYISDASGTEGDTVGFVVSLSKVLSADLTFSYLSTSVTATDGIDYAALSGVGTVPAGGLQVTLSSVLTDDASFEGPETFEVSLSGLSANGEAGDLLGLGTIIDSDLPPQLFAADATAFEGEALQFVVSLDQVAGQPVSFNYMTVNNTATAGVDYMATAGTGTIGAGLLQITIDVNGLQDVAVEGDEALDFNLSAPVNATITDATGVGTIQDDETLVFIDDISGNEGETLDFVVSLASALNIESSFEASTFFSGSANGSDITLLTNFGVTLAAGQTVTIVSVVTTDDVIFEGDESFGVTLSNLTQLEVGDDVATGTIFDNEPAPQLYLSDVAVNEGEIAEVVVTLSVLSEVDVIFDFEPVSGTATVGNDFVYSMDQATLPMGDLAITITVDTLTDAIDEFDEIFSVTASIVSGALAGDLVATVSLNDINPAPTLSVFNTGESESNQASVVVSLDAISAKPVTFSYQTYDSEAIGGVDYQSASGTSILSAGSSQMTITVDYIEDFLAEADETFLFSLSSLVNADAGVDLGSVTIFDNDPSPAIYIDDALATEGNTMFFLATLSAINGQDSIFDVNTSDGTALAGADYTSYSATVTILSGGWAATIAINTLPDSIDEDAQGFSVDLSSLQNLNAGDIAAVGSITDDDPLPQLFINPSSEDEGTNLSFVISMDRLSERDAGFDYQTYDGTASISDSDYSATSGSFTFAPGALSTNVVVPVTTDLTVEGDETLTLSLSAANNLSFVSTSVLGTILNNDFPQLDIYDATVTEGGTLQFVASLSQTSVNDVIFTANTSSGTATSGVDFTALSSVVVTIASGSQQTFVNVSTIQDTDQEGDEDFTLALSNVSQATGGDTNATGTIEDDDIINPTVVISTSEPDPTISDPILFNISFSDDVTGFALSDIVVGNGTKANFNQISPSFYRFYLYPTAEGIVSVDVPADSAFDGEGDGNLAALQLTLTWQEGLPPDPPTSIQLLDPLSSPSTDTTPTIRVAGLTNGNTVRLYSDGGCTNELASATASGSNYTFNVGPLASGVHLFFANQSDGLGTSNCSSAFLQYEVTSGYIVTEDFEDSTIGPLWNQVATDDHDWTLNSGSTPSTDVGPTSASDGGTYIYTEASNPVAANEEFILESGSLDAGANQLNLEFKWNKRGSNMGDLYVEVSTNGGSTWDSAIWSHLGSDVPTGGSDAWRTTKLSLCGYGYNSGNVLVRFRAVMPAGGNIYESDIGLDEIVVKDGPCVSVAITSPNEGQQFVDAEAGSITVAGSCSEDGESVNVSGAATASTTCSGGAFSTTVDLSAVYGDANLIVQHTDGGGGLAVDSVAVYRSIISDDFESGTIGSNWTQAAYDQYDWTVQTGGTGSNGTGPSAAAGGQYYIYTETSNPVGTGDEFIIESPSLDASVNLKLMFDYHMYGAAMGSLNVDVSTNGGSTWDAAIWSQTGDQGDLWRSASVNLCSAGYSSGNVLIRFRGVKGTDFTSDIALDNIVVEPASSCVELDITSPLASTIYIDSTNDDSVAFSGTCSENGQDVVASGDATGTTTCSGGTWSMNLDFTSAQEGPLTVFFEHENVGGDKARRSKTLEKVIQIDTFDGGALGSNWVQAAYDQRDWTVNSGGTPSNNVGPTDDATGGASYLYTEASNPVNANDEFVLESTVIDAAAYNLGLQFEYNMRGDNMGALYVDVSDDGGSTWDLDVTSIGGQNANTGDPDVWSQRSVNLCELGYTGNNVKIRFRAVMPAAGNVWNSDIAIDNLVLRNLSQCN